MDRTENQGSKNMADRFSGCLLGGAVGDALGAPVEFWSQEQIERHFGREGVREYLPVYGGPGAITDDTQMTLFTAEGLIRGVLRQRLRGIGPAFQSTVARAYLRWLKTQGVEPLVPVESDGYLYQQSALHTRRAPGLTCLSSLAKLNDTTCRAQNNSKGCGGVMRVAPVGLLCWHTDRKHALRQAFQLGCDLAAITHGHPSGILPAGVFAAGILLLLDGQELTAALTKIKPLLKKHSGHAETLAAIEKAERLSADVGVAPRHAIRELGEGWVAEEALAIALYAAMRADSFENGVVMAVSHGGDSDSTGAIAGNLLGAQAGKGAIPARWLDQLELCAVIEGIGQDLFALPTWDVSDDASSRDSDWACKKYPPH